MNQYETPPVMPGSLGKPAPAWPMTIGIVSIVLGSLGALNNTCQSVTGLLGGTLGQMFFKFIGSQGAMQKDPRGAQMLTAMEEFLATMKPWMVISGVLSLVNLGVSVWLLVAGIKLSRRTLAGVRMHVTWAWARSAMVLVTAALAAVTQQVSAEAMAKVQAAQGGPVPPMWFGAAMGYVGVVVSVVIGLTYPVIVLWYLKREESRREIDRWNA